ncbi:MAG: hypothetical protein AB1457_14325 [Chloroflexota bacterium]|nr:MAG: hypothetical protein KatS3mg045_1273 [Bellilinea sp.]
MTNIPLVLLFGMLFSIQVHLAKALQRQGIEIFEQIKKRQVVQGGLRKPVIYTVGVILNNTLFIWSTLAQPYGPPALFSSMFGVGLVFLMIYAAVVLKESINRREVVGATAIILGTLAIGYENVLRGEMLDRFTMNLRAFFLILGAWLTFSVLFIFSANRSGNLKIMALAYGLLAGSLGGLDPFLKGVGQNYGGASAVIPATTLGNIIFVSSFVIGFLAFVITQIGFARKVRASLLVPAYNAAFIGLPVFWQLFLLPDYSLTILTALGLTLIIGGVAAMQTVIQERGK